jgi:ethanolamine utilization protein EutN
MLLARVVGNVVSTAKNDSLTGKKLLILQPIDAQGQDRNAKLIALDSVGAGAGETVYYCRGREASFPWYPDEVPADATIVGIVDRVNVEKKPGPGVRRQKPEIRRQESEARSQEKVATRKRRAKN